jgi:hypothetical protein
LLLVFNEFDPVPVANDLKVLQLEMKVGDRELSDATGESLLSNEVYKQM